jgi:hypothetical protein
VAFFQSSIRDAQDRIHVLAAVGCRPQHESDLFHKSSVGIDSLKKSAFTCWMRSGFAAGPGLSAQIKQLISVEQTYKRFLYIYFVLSNRHFSFIIQEYSMLSPSISVPVTERED